MYGRREVGVVLADSTLASALSESFDTYWNSEYSKSLEEEDLGIHINIYVIIAGISIAVALIVVIWAWRTIKSRKEHRRSKIGWKQYP